MLNRASVLLAKGKKLCSHSTNYNSENILFSLAEPLMSLRMNGSLG